MPPTAETSNTAEAGSGTATFIVRAAIRHQDKRSSSRSVQSRIDSVSRIRCSTSVSEECRIESLKVAEHNVVPSIVRFRIPFTTVFDTSVYTRVKFQPVHK